MGTGWKCCEGKRRAKNDLEGRSKEGSEEVWVEGRGYARLGQVEKNDMDEWKQQLVARLKQCCPNDDDE